MRPTNWPVWGSVVIDSGPQEYNTHGLACPKASHVLDRGVTGQSHLLKT